MLLSYKCLAGVLLRPSVLARPSATNTEALAFTMALPIT